MTQLCPIVIIDKKFFIDVSNKEVVMERSNKKLILLSLIISIFLLTGCDKIHFNFINTTDEKITDKKVTEAPVDNKDENDVTSVKSEDPDETSRSEETDKSTVATTSKEAISPTPSLIAPVANIDLPIYTINGDTGEVEATTALIPKGSEITPGLIVEQVVESMADRSLKVGIEDVTTKNDTVIVSFYHNQAPLNNEVGAEYETSILDAIAQSLTENLKDYKKVIYRVEGKAYVSGHLEFGINEVYFEDK
jgi:cytoskeletal protein RodZ